MGVSRPKYPSYKVRAVALSLSLSQFSYIP
nr:MAG TPA: hypothetical protein [Caudoviricetes sp.]